MLGDEDRVVWMVPWWMERSPKAGHFSHEVVIDEQLPLGIDFDHGRRRDIRLKRGNR